MREKRRDGSYRDVASVPEVIPVCFDSPFNERRLGWSENVLPSSFIYFCGQRLAFPIEESIVDT
jgi:hypothetical protein